RRAAATDIEPLSLHDALPISARRPEEGTASRRLTGGAGRRRRGAGRPEGEITLQEEEKAMQKWHRGFGRVATVGVLALAGVASACGYAKRDEMHAELARVRQEMQAGDEAVSQSLTQRINEVNARVDALNRDLEALRNDFNVTVERLEGMLSFNVPVHFDFDRSD